VKYLAIIPDELHFERRMEAQVALRIVAEEWGVQLHVIGEGVGDGSDRLTSIEEELMHELMDLSGEDWHA
jgi:hypothetical protein